MRPNPARQTPRWPVYPLPGNDTLRPPAGGKQSRPGGTNRDSLILPPSWPGPQRDTMKKSNISVGNAEQYFWKQVAIARNHGNICLHYMVLLMNTSSMLLAVWGVEAEEERRSAMRIVFTGAK